MKLSTDELRLWNEIGKNLLDVAREPHKFDLDTDEIIQVNQQLEKVHQYLMKVKHITSSEPR